MKYLSVTIMTKMLGLCVCCSLMGGSRLAWAIPKNPATWGLEIRFSPYQPKIGKTPIDGTPYNERDYYKKFFGNDYPMMIGVELDRFLYYKFGHVGVYVRGSYWKTEGHSRVCMDDNQEVITCDTTSFFENSMAGNDTTTLLILPVTVGALYRFTYLHDQWQVPVVPYAKAGLDYFFWWSQGGGKVSSAGGRQGKGGTSGYHGSLGLALNLDWIEASGEGRRVFQNCYFFGEYSMIKANDFGNQKKLNMSAKQFSFGLSFDFE